ncbi:MAG: hypothetical protein QXT93_01260 [Thermofilum sp.]
MPGPLPTSPEVRPLRERRRPRSAQPPLHHLHHDLPVRARRAVQNGKLPKLTLVSRAGLITFPTVYALAPSPAPIFMWQALSGPFTAPGAVVTPLYVIEVAEPELKPATSLTTTWLKAWQPLPAQR